MGGARGILEQNKKKREQEQQEAIQARGSQELTETVDINRAVATGRYMVKEMIGVIQLKKYRAMKQRYYDDDAETLAAHKQAEAIADELRRGKKA